MMEHRSRDRPAAELHLFATPPRGFRPYQPGHASMQAGPLCGTRRYEASRAAV